MYHLKMKGLDLLQDKLREKYLLMKEITLSIYKNNRKLINQTDYIVLHTYHQ